MITAASAAVARHRRAVLVAGTAAAAGATAGLVRSDEAGGFLTGLFLAAGVCLAAAAAAWLADRWRPGPAFEIGGGGAYRTRRGAAPVLAALGHVALLGALAGPGLWLLRAGAFDAAWLFLVLLVAAPLPYCAAAAWRGSGVTVTADGLRVDRAAGVLSVPWAALDRRAAAYPLPGGGEVGLRYARADLARTRGLVPVRDRLRVEGAAAAVTAAAICRYAADPERRAAIGTPAGLRLLRRDPPGPAVPADPPAPAPTAQALRLRALAGVAVFAAATTAGMLLGPEHAMLAQAALLPAVLGLRGAIAAAAGLRNGTSRPAGPPGGS